MNVKTSVQAGRLGANRCESVARPLTVRTSVQAGKLSANRCLSGRN